MAARTGTTVFVGDSLTGDGSWGGLAADDGSDPIDLGRPGHTSEDVLALLPEVVAAHPRTVVILTGTHDLGAARRGPEATVRTIETILVHLRRDLPDARLVMLSVPPRGREHAERIRIVNVHVRQFAPTVHAEYVDLWPALGFGDGELNPAYTDDRLHLTDDGVAALREVLAPVLAAGPGAGDADGDDADDGTAGDDADPEGPAD